MRHTIGSSWRLRKLPTFCRVSLVVRGYPLINIKLEWQIKWETCFQLLKLKRQTNKQKISLLMSYKRQSDTKHEVSQPSTDTACLFCAEKKCLDSQFRSGTDRDVQSLSEALINTETRQEQPAVIPSCCSRQFYPPAEREGEKHDSQNLMKYARILIHRKAFWRTGTRNCRVQIRFEQQRQGSIWEQSASKRNKEVVHGREKAKGSFMKRFIQIDFQEESTQTVQTQLFSDVWSWTKTLKVMLHTQKTLS